MSDGEAATVGAAPRQYALENAIRATKRDGRGRRIVGAVYRESLGAPRAECPTCGEGTRDCNDSTLICERCDTLVHTQEAHRVADGEVWLCNGCHRQWQKEESESE